MSLDALKRFLAGRDRAESDADALAAWLADVTTPRPIPLAGLTALLRKAGLERRLKEIIADPDTPQQAREGLEDFLAHVGDGRQQNLDTTDPVVAAQVAGVLRYLTQAGQVDAAGRDAIYALGGGLRHDPAVTAGDVAAARESLARTDAVEALWAAAVAEFDAARALQDARNAKLADLRNDPALPVPASLAELLDGGE